MHAEIAAAADFVAGFVVAVDRHDDGHDDGGSSSFKKALATRLERRFMGHWHDQEPERGSAYRAIVRLGRDHVDPVLVGAAHDSGLISSDGDGHDHHELERVAELLRTTTHKEHKITLGDRWTLWIDPRSVCVKVERSDSARDSAALAILGPLPAALACHSQQHFSPSSLASQLKDMSLSSSSAAADAPESFTPPFGLSPVKRSSRAIQIVAPRGRDTPTSPPTALAPAAPILSTPVVIPPTPVRPLDDNDDDKDDDALIGRAGGIQSSPLARLRHRASTPSSLYHAFSAGGAPGDLSVESSPVTSNTGAERMHMLARPHSRAASSSSSASTTSADDSSDAGGCGPSSLFSASTESLSSSYTSNDTFAAAAAGQSKDAPSMRRSHHHTRSESAANMALPPALSLPLAPSTTLARHGHSHSFHGLPSTPQPPPSPSKSRRRGTRGGGGGGHHRDTTSISSISSVLSPALKPTSAGHTKSASTSSISAAAAADAVAVARSREDALKGNYVEHSGGKVGVLGGGVLLGVASASSSTTSRPCASPLPSPSSSSLSAHSNSHEDGSLEHQQAYMGNGHQRSSRRSRDRRRGHGARATSHGSASSHNHHQGQRHAFFEPGPAYPPMPVPMPMPSHHARMPWDV